MASSSVGFAVDMDLVKAYHVLNRDKKEAYILTKYSADGKKLILQEKGPLKKKNAKNFAEKNKHWEDILSKLPDNEIRYIPIQVDFKDAKNAVQNEIVLMIWAPDNVEILKRMHVEQHRDIILKCFAGIRDTLIVKSKEEMNVTNVVKDRLKGSLD